MGCLVHVHGGLVQGMRGNGMLCELGSVVVSDVVWCLEQSSARVQRGIICGVVERGVWWGDR